jgi:hypothetical protein
MDPEAVISLLAIVFVAGIMVGYRILLSQRNDATGGEGEGKMTCESLWPR